MSELTDEQLQIDAALETWFYPGEFDSRVKAVQETARVWDGIVAALEIGDSDADVVKTITDMQAEIIALRAERAKPTQSDEERAREIVVKWYDGEDSNYHAELVNNIANAFASIRAEGSAELEAARATLDDEIASHQDTLRLWNELRAGRAKLEAKE